MRIFEETGVSRVEILKCESGILQFCNWRPMVPTSTEILKLLLFITNTSQDFTSIIEKTNEYVFSCLLSYEFCPFRYSTLALTCLLLVLEEHQFTNFQQGLISLIVEYEIPFDFSEVEICKT